MNKTACFAGGCFWCTEAIFQKVSGVISITPGYTGGHTKNPSYEQVCSGSTGHTEAIEIIFDPQKLPYQTLLEIFFSAHDPTTLNKQGNDIGTQYRSAIYYFSEKQKQLAEAARAQITNCITEIVPAATFYPAEKFHQNYFLNHPEAPYCQIVIQPKLKKLLTGHGLWFRNT